MVATLVRLHLTLLGRSLRRSVWQTIGFVVIALYEIFFVAMMVLGLTGLRGRPHEVVAAVTVPAFGALTLAWIIVPLLIAGVDQTLEPARFALLPLRARQLMPGLFLAGLIGLGGLGTLALGFGYVAAWAGTSLTLLTSVVGMVIGVATCFLFSRVATSAFARWLSSRRFRDLATVMLVLFILAASIALQFVTGGLVGQDMADLERRLVAAERVVGWTPIGWAWSLPADLAAAGYGAAAAKLALAVGLLAALWRAWQVFLDRALLSPLDAGAPQGSVKGGARIDALFGPTPSGAIAARSLRYWRRDPRHVITLASVATFPLIMIASQFTLSSISTGSADLGPAMFLLAPVLGLSAGLGLISELSYDGSALWTHITAGVRGFADRWGRVWAFAIILVPTIVVCVVIAIVIDRSAGLALLSLGAGLGLMGVGCGVASLFGAMWQSPSPPPGVNPFSKGAGMGVGSLMSTLVLMIAGGLLAVPVGWAGFWTLNRGLLTTSLVGAGSLLWGALICWAGMVLGGRWLDARWPEMLKAVSYDKA